MKTKALFLWIAVSACVGLLSGVTPAKAQEKGVVVEVEDKLLFHRQMLDKYTNRQMHDLTAYLVTLK